MASRRESRAHSNGLNILQEFESLRKTFKASNDRLAKKNNELLAQISQLNKQLQESTAENFQLRGALSTLQRKNLLDNVKVIAYQRERQAMLDLVDETTRAADWAKKNLASLRRSFDSIDTAEPPATSPPTFFPKPRSSTSTALKVSAAPEMELIHEDSKEDLHTSPGTSRPRKVAQSGPSRLSSHPTESTPVTGAAVSSLNEESLISTPGSHSVLKRKALRRQSGLLTPVDLNSRPPSPITPNPNASDMESSPPPDYGISSSPAPPESSDLTIRSLTSRGKRKLSVDEKVHDDSPEYSAISGLHDVTNSPPPRLIERKSKKSSQKANSAQEDSDYMFTPPISRVERRRRKTNPDTPDDGEQEKLMKSVPSSTDTLTIKPPSFDTQRTASPAPRSQSPIPQPIFGAALIGSQPVEGGRERRARKSINYAEPKLNTKMRKPDGFEASFKNRLSTSVSTVKRGSPPPPPQHSTTSTEQRDTGAPTSPNPRSSSPVVEDDEPIRPMHGAKEQERIRPRHRAWHPDANANDDADEEQDRKVPKWKMYSRATSTLVPSPPCDTAATHDSNTKVLSVMALGDEGTTTMTKRKRRVTSYANLEPSDEENDDGEYKEDGDYDIVLPRSVSGRRKSSAIAWDRK